MQTEDAPDSSSHLPILPGLRKVGGEHLLPLLLPLKLGDQLHLHLVWQLQNLGQETGPKC